MSVRPPNKEALESFRPKFKNWKAICEIPDPLFRMAIALTDLTTDFGQMVATRLREYFSTAPLEPGPVPLSIIKKTAEMRYMEDHKDDRDADISRAFDFCDSYRGIPDRIPKIEFGHDGEAAAEWRCEVIPSEYFEVVKKFRIGDTFQWKDKTLMVMENNMSPNVGTIISVPAELILVDIPEIKPTAY